MSQNNNFATDWSRIDSSMAVDVADVDDPDVEFDATKADETTRVTGDMNSEPVRFERITSAELAGGDYSLSYLVEGVLVDQQPGLVSGPHKSLKTNILVDLSISLAAGGRFLGVFRVPEAVRVGVMSGESGLATLQETGQRIARAAGYDLAMLDNLVWSPDLPIFGHLEYMAALRDFIKADGLRVVVIDPAYLCTPLAADKANNLFAMGELLRSVNDVCQDAGCTLLIAHHMKRTGVAHDPPELSDAAWSGWAEWARQWLLINRREKYDPDSNGEHKLWFAVGGSAGHSGLWGVDIEEGRRDAPEGRYWDVTVRPASDVRAEVKDDRQAEKRREASAKFEKELDTVAQALDEHPDGATRTRLREHCGMSGTKFGKAIAELVRRGIAETCDVQVSNHKKPSEGYRRAPDSTDNPV